MLLLGYFLGTAIPDLDKHIELVVIGVVFVSFLPVLFKYLKHRKENPREK
jgi:membrane-associated protein